ncbi:hypothetical protein A4H97_03945 [Niastella yeongjuensis]|uniref:DUF1203 domain-containing protein n=1 Tax=Niastella yeongjuensis TaxID=354355 RepID=A0A1V9EYG4_9BACT|nr:DUF1203 domain-containing protein [Niastella yeongjuensis]OQP50984.1 hypothetical protein A4H97_03945 [Niastella yeongjuensis]SEN08421.1 Protein of unknown function [Niastella yeongjuensis]
MRKFKIVPLSKEYAAQVRDTGKDAYGHAVIEQIATGLGPCRVSLKPFKKGIDTRLLISHSPFAVDNPYNQPGPVFINKEEVEEYQDVYRFPPEIKANKKSFPLSLIGYSKEQLMVFTQLVGDDDVDELIPNIFELHSEIEYLHARNAQACCYICKIERVDETSL